MKFLIREEQKGSELKFMMHSMLNDRLITWENNSFGIRINKLTLKTMLAEQCNLVHDDLIGTIFGIILEF